MICGLEGIPGSGKSYEATVHHILAALKKGRKVITNVPLNLEAFAAIDPGYVDLLEVRKQPLPVLGSWDANAAGRGESAFVLGEFKPGAEPVQEGGRMVVKPADSVQIFGHVWDFYDTWRGEGGLGPLYVIDECHVSFPKRSIETPGSTAAEVIQWFKLSRHFGADVLLMTQSFRDVHPSITALIATLIKVRKADVLGRKGEYIRKVHAGYRGGLVAENIRKYEKQYFGLYQSHTQGSTVAEADAQDVSPFIKKWKLWTRVVMCIGIAGCVWAFWPEGKKSSPQADRFLQDIAKTPAGHTLKYQNGVPVHVSPMKPEMSASSQEKSEPLKALSEGAASKTVASSQENAEPVPVEPLEGKLLHLTGSMLFKGKLLYTFELSDKGQRILSMDSSQLQEAGYRYRHLAHCMGIISWQGVEKAVTCDAPRVTAGVESKPVVITDPRAGVGQPQASAVPVHQPEGPHPMTAAARTSTLVTNGQL